VQQKKERDGNDEHLKAAPRTLTKVKSEAKTKGKGGRAREGKGKREPSKGQERSFVKREGRQEKVVRMRGRPCGTLFMGERGG